MNPNLMNLEIVTRSMREREMELRRAAHAMPAVERDSYQPVERAERPRKQRGIAAAAAWVFALIAR